MLFIHRQTVPLRPVVYDGSFYTVMFKAGLFHGKSLLRIVAENRDSSVSVVTTLVLDDPGFEPRQLQKMSLFSKTSRPAVGPL